MKMLLYVISELRGKFTYVIAEINLDNLQTSDFSKPKEIDYDDIPKENIVFKFPLIISKDRESVNSNMIWVIPNKEDFDDFDHDIIQFFQTITKVINTLDK